MNIEITNEILDKINNVNIRDGDGNTPLHLLFSIFGKSQTSSSKIAALLLEKGADPNAYNDDL